VGAAPGGRLQMHLPRRHCLVTMACRRRTITLAQATLLLAVAPCPLDLQTPLHTMDTAARLCVLRQCLQRHGRQHRMLLQCSGHCRMRCRHHRLRRHHLSQIVSPRPLARRAARRTLLHHVTLTLLAAAPGAVMQAANTSRCGHPQCRAMLLRQLDTPAAAAAGLLRCDHPRRRAQPAALPARRWTHCWPRTRSWKPQQASPLGVGQPRQPMAALRPQFEGGQLAQDLCQQQPLSPAALLRPPPLLPSRLPTRLLERGLPHSPGGLS